MSYFWKIFLAPAVALVKSVILYSQLSSSDWTLRPTLVVVLSLVPPSSPSPRIHSLSTLESVLSSVALLRWVLVMNWLDPIEELYNMYSEEDTPRIVEVENDDLDFDSDIEGPADPYMDL